MIIYQGPSLLDGKPIIAVAIPKTRNKKTGNMVQTYIIRADIDPRLANKNGQDYSICGSCPHRGDTTDDPTKTVAINRRCYVNITQGPLIVYKAFLRGVYSNIIGHSAIAAIGKGKMVRLGTYGDPAAVPAYIWTSLISQANGHTAYSHQASMNNAAFDPAIMMLSADSSSDAFAAWAKGIRTFRVIQDVSQVIKNSEILCPASKEAGKRSSCNACGLCGGSSVKAKSIAIVDHGWLKIQSRKAFELTLSKSLVAA